MLMIKLRAMPPLSNVKFFLEPSVRFSSCVTGKIKKLIKNLDAARGYGARS